MTKGLAWHVREGHPNPASRTTNQIHAHQPTARNRRSILHFRVPPAGCDCIEVGRVTGPQSVELEGRLDFSLGDQMPECSQEGSLTRLRKSHDNDRVLI